MHPLLPLFLPRRVGARAGGRALVRPALEDVDGGAAQHLLGDLLPHGQRDEVEVILVVQGRGVADGAHRVAGGQGAGGLHLLGLGLDPVPRRLHPIEQLRRQPRVHHHRALEEGDAAG